MPHAFQELIENITYQNTSEAPAAARTISLTVSDGDGGTSAAQSVVVNVAPTNDAPVLGSVVAHAQRDRKRRAATVLDSSVAVTDADSANFNGGQLSLTYTSGGGSEDQFTIRTNGNISFDGTNVTFFGVGIIATVNGSHNGQNGETLVLDLTGLANAARLQELIENITYQNTSDNPAAARTISMTVSDGDGGTSAAQSVVVNVAPVNDAPVLGSVVATLNVTENDAATVLDSSVALTDADSANFSGGQLSLTYTSGGGAEDQFTLRNHGNISFDGTNVNSSPASASSPPSMARTTAKTAKPSSWILTGLANAARLQELIENITYQNTSDNPAAARTISMTVSDGDGGTSAAQSVVVNVAPANDAPVLGSVVATLNVTENDAATVLDSSVALTDADSANFSGGQLSLTYTSGGGAEDQFTFATTATSASTAPTSLSPASASSPPSTPPTTVKTVKPWCSISRACECRPPPRADRKHYLPKHVRQSGRSAYHQPHRLRRRRWNFRRAIRRRQRRASKRRAVLGSVVATLNVTENDAATVLIAASL